MNHVCICVPHFGSVALEWVETTYGPLRFLAQPDYAKSFKTSRGILNLDTHRNLITKMALEDKTVTHLLWLDADNIIESPTDVNQALRILLTINIPVISGLYRAKKAKGNYPYAMWVKHSDGVPNHMAALSSWTGNFIKVDAIGFGFVLVKREVFEKIPFPWFVWDKESPSEDFEFCAKIAEAGYEVKVYTDVRLSHGMSGKILTDGQVRVHDM